MQDHRGPSSDEHAAEPLRWLARLFLIAGATALIWCGIIVADGAIGQRDAQRALEIAMAVEDLTSVPAEKADVPARRRSVVAGSAIAALSIPRVQLSATVLHGSDARTLQRGPGHLEHTAAPGEAGNIVIAGHRDSFFRPLRDIQLGDDIFLETPDGQFHYRVTSLRVVGPRDVSVLAATSEEVLTLITCYPFWVLGHAPDRFIVRAARVEAGSPPRLEARHLSARDWLDAPAIHPTVHGSMATPPAATVYDDETLVRQAVRSYFVVKGVPPVSCVVRITGDHASAGCEPVGEPLAQEPGRVFALERSRNTWAIRSIELTSGP